MKRAVAHALLIIAEAAKHVPQSMKDARPEVLTQRSTPDEIRRCASARRVSQPVFVHDLNVSESIVSKWERGDKKPDGASLKLLNLVRTNLARRLRQKPARLQKRLGPCVAPSETVILHQVLMEVLGSEPA